VHTVLNHVLSLTSFILILNPTRCTLDIISAIKLITPGHIFVLGRSYTLLLQTDMRIVLDGHPGIQFDHDILHVKGVLSQILIVLHVEIEQWTPLRIKYVLVWVIMFCFACPDAHQLVVIDCEVIVEAADRVGQNQVRFPYLGRWQVDQVDFSPLRWIPGQSFIIPTKDQLTLEFSHIYILVWPDYMVNE